MLRRAVNILLLFPFLFVVACPAQAQEIFVSGGFVTDTRHGTSSGQWSVAYVQGLAEYAAFSISYINEGHQPNHYRDGLAPQIWGRAAPFGPNLSLAIGMGPYVYFDTKVVDASDQYENLHGLGVISSATATWYGLSPFLLQLRANHIRAPKTFDSFSATFGIGYLLNDNPVLEYATGGRKGRSATYNEICFFLGKTVLNSAKSEQGDSMGIEYRRNIFRYLDWTIAWLSEGRKRPIGRYGVMSELWVVRGFFDERLEFGIGGGPYLVREKHSADEGQTTKLAGVVSLTAIYRFTSRFGLRSSFHRVVTDNSRDTDIFMGGVAVSF